MAQAAATKLYKSFIKGLITEAGYLNYPEDASTDELNTVVSLKGDRSRRIGIDYEAGYVKTNVTLTEDLAVNQFTWSTVANRPDVNFLVVQTGKTLRFFDLSHSAASAGLKSFTVSLETHIATGYSVADLQQISASFANGKGYLFVVHEMIDPFLVEYLPDADTISVTPVNIMIRDFEGVDDGLANDAEPATLSKEHKYNLRNQGWVSPAPNVPDPITLYYSGNFGDGLNTPGIGVYPGNNKQWWVGKAADKDTSGTHTHQVGDFVPTFLNKTYFGNTRVARGHYVLNPFRKDRSAVSGIPDLPIQVVNSRPNSIAFFSGRAWFSCESTLYFSQVIDNKSKIGQCLQEADPTSENISDLVKTDGGVVPIPEAEKIVKLIPYSDGVLIFGSNGVWYVSGGGNTGFAADDLAVSKISAIGTISPNSVVTIDKTVFWWSTVGINALTETSGLLGPLPGKFGNTNIAEQTVQTFYNNIPDAFKPYAKGVYDPRTNTILWIYNDGNVTGNYCYNSVLLYDATLQAFYPWKFSTINNGPKVSGIFENISTVNLTSNDIVQAIPNVTVTANDTTTVVVHGQSSAPRHTQVNFTVTEGGYFTVANINNAAFVDWETFDGVGATYDSYVVGGYDIFNDSMRSKFLNYVFVHLKFQPDDNCSCTMQVQWDWASGQNSNKWSSPVQVYRPRNVAQLLASSQDTTEFPVVTSKNRVRGNGKAIQFKFGSSERGKDFDLLGWSIAASGNTSP